MSASSPPNTFSRSASTLACPCLAASTQPWRISTLSAARQLRFFRQRALLRRISTPSGSRWATPALLLQQRSGHSHYSATSELRSPYRARHQGRWAHIRPTGPGADWFALKTRRRPRMSCWAGEGGQKWVRSMRLSAAISAAFFLSLFPMLAADGVPVLNVKKTCQEAEAVEVNLGWSQESCLRSEETARDQLSKEWSNFPAADRVECGRMVKIGPPSYIDLLTCLEIRRDARQRQQGSPEITDRSTGHELHGLRQSAQQEQTRTGLSWDQIREVQRALLRQGYYAGSVDGNFGPKTERALRQFQKAQQLPVTGKIGGVSRDQIRKVQRALLRQGYYAGSVDGNFGPKTERALRQFQKAQQLSVTGQLDDGSLAALQADQTEVGGEKSTGPKEIPTSTSPSTPQAPPETFAPTSPSPSTPQAPPETSAPTSPSTPQAPPETSAPTTPSTPQETSAQRSPDNQPSALSQKPNAPGEPIAGEGAKRSWWRSLWKRLWGR